MEGRFENICRKTGFSSGLLRSLTGAEFLSEKEIIQRLFQEQGEAARLEMYEYIILNGFGTDAAKIALKRSECLDPCQILEWVFESCGDSQSPTKKSAEKRSEKGEKKLGKIGDTLVNLEANEDENLSVTPSKLKKRYCLPIQHLLDGNSNLSVYTPTSEEIEAIRRRVAEREARKKMKNEKIQHYPVVDVAEGSGLKASDEVKQQNYRVEVAGRGKKGKVEEIQRNSVAGSGEEEQV